MAIVKSKNKEFTGTRAGVSFVNGEAETDNQWSIDWFKNNGYEVSEPKTTKAKAKSEEGEG